MKAHLLGFGMRMPGEITIPDLLTYTSTVGGGVYAGHDRLLYTKDNQKFHLGLLLTLKDHRRFCELHGQGKSRKINVREAVSGSSLVDFNFFAIRKTTGRGFFQWYHQSCHPKTFGKFCTTRLGRLQHELIGKAVAANGGDDITDKKRIEIEKKYQGPLEWEMIVRKEKFEAIIKRLKRIGTFEFGFSTLLPEEERRFRPFKGVSKRVRHKVSFSQDKVLADRRDAILQFFKAEKDDLTEAAVECEDEDGLDKIIRISQNPDSFGHYEFDDLAKGMDFEPEEFDKSWFMKELLRVAEEYPGILEPKAN